MKTLNDITLYDLMADDMDVWIARNKKFGFNLQIEDREGQTTLDEKGIHPYAIDSLVDFCRQFLTAYDKLNQRDAA